MTPEQLALLRSALVTALDQLGAVEPDDTIPHPTRNTEFEGVRLSDYFRSPLSYPGMGARLMVWEEMESRKFRELDPSLRAGIMGTAGGHPKPRCWETHKALLAAAERGDLRPEMNGGPVAWDDPDGEPFNRFKWMAKSTEEMHRLVLFFWHADTIQTPGRRWRQHPDNWRIVQSLGEPQM